ncbi:MAG: hypothetical protein ACLQFR_06145 [Streptosporangiaceae bacterium]
MEPAVGRREHAWLEAYDQPPTILPQWSPPLDGGSTLPFWRQQMHRHSPQWSPPLDGGSTARSFEAV